MENVIHLGTENTPQPLLTETLLRPLVRGQDEVVVEAELGAAVQPGAGPGLLLSVSNDFIT